MSKSQWAAVIAALVAVGLLVLIDRPPLVRRSLLSALDGVEYRDVTGKVRRENVWARSTVIYIHAPFAETGESLRALSQEASFSGSGFEGTNAIAESTDQKDFRWILYPGKASVIGIPELSTVASSSTEKGAWCTLCYEEEGHLRRLIRGIFGH